MSVPHASINVRENMRASLALKFLTKLQVKALLAHAGDDDARPTFCIGVYPELGHVVATDGHRCACLSLDPWGGEHYMIPRDAFERAVKACERGGMIRIGPTELLVFPLGSDAPSSAFAFAPGHALAFPPYAKILPQGSVPNPCPVISLGMVRPREIRRVYCTKRPESDRKEWEEHRARALAQKELFVDAETETKDLVFMPVQYRACFRCDDSACTTEHDMSILDWGIYALSRRQFATRGGAMAERDVISKIEEMMDPTKRDPYFFLGNTKPHPQSFMIVGLYYPPKVAEKPAKAANSLKLPGF